MELICYHRMDHRAKKRLTADKYAYGKKIPYKPSTKMLSRLAKELHWSKEEVWRQIIREREFLRRQIGVN